MLTTIFASLLTLIFIVITAALILVILIQRPQGGGLSGAFGAAGGGGASQTAFGAKTGDILTIVTVAVFVAFLGLAITHVLLNISWYGEGSNARVVPNKPTELVVEAVETGNIKLTWEDNSDNEEYFNIERSIDGETGWLNVGRASADEVEYTDNNLQPDATYYYRVSAVNPIDRSDYTEVSFATALLPVAPVEDAADNLETDSTIPDDLTTEETVEETSDEAPNEDG